VLAVSYGLGLDIDPNEDSTILKKYAARTSSIGTIAVARAKWASSSPKNYDVDFLNPPLQADAVHRQDRRVYGLPFGVKSALSIQKTIASYLTQ